MPFLLYLLYIVYESTLMIHLYLRLSLDLDFFYFSGMTMTTLERLHNIFWIECFQTYGHKMAYDAYVIKCILNINHFILYPIDIYQLQLSRSLYLKYLICIIYI